MNFIELKGIIRHLKKVVPCSTCQKKFMDEGIKVLSTHNMEGLFHFTCYNCSNQLIVHVSIVEQTDKVNRVNIQATNAPHVSPNEVLDIHNFLSRFNGDFKDLFSSEMSS